MIEQHDEELSRIYSDADGPRPPQRVDDNILAASQRVAGPRRAGFAHRWGVPVALAATVLVTSTLALMVYERQSGLDATAPQVPRAGRPEKVSPAVPKRADPPAKSPPAESRAGPLEKPPPAEPPSAAPAPAAPVPQAAAPLDRAKQRTVETALSSERRATGQSARVPEIPRGVEILRKSEEVKPAPSVAAPAANARAGAIPPQPPVSDAQRVFDAQQQIRSTLAPAAGRPSLTPNSFSLRASFPFLPQATHGTGIVRFRLLSGISLYTAAAPRAALDSSHDRRKTRSRVRRGGKAGDPIAPAEAARAGPDRRRRGRRSERYCDLFAGRRAVRLRHAVVGAVHAAAHDRHPDRERAHRPRDRARARRQHPAAQIGRASCRRHLASSRRQHDQHRRRSGRDGGGAATARRGIDAPLHRRFRAGVARTAGLHSLSPVRAVPEVADARALRLRRHGVRGAGAVARGRIAHDRPGPRAPRGLSAHARGSVRHHHQPVSLFLAGFAGSGGAARR